MIKRIAFVISNLGGGGAERTVCNLANEFALLGYEVLIIMSSTSVCEYTVADSVKFVKLECLELNKYPALFRRIVRCKIIGDAIKKEMPDVVVAFKTQLNIDVSVALWNKKIPLIVSERSDPSKEFTSKAKEILRKIAYFRPDGFVFQSDGAKNYFSERIQKKSCVILNPVSRELPKRFEGVRDKRIVAVGRLVKLKNFEMLIKAFSEFHKNHSEYSLEIYGKGDMQEQLSKLITEEELSESVKLMGFCTDVNNKVKNAYAFVLSSDYEGLPNALLEAMCMGMTCISTNCPCGGPAMIIDNGVTGILVDVNDGQAVTDALEKITNDPAYAESLGRNAYKLKEKTDIAYVTNQWLEFMKERISK